MERLRILNITGSAVVDLAASIVATLEQLIALNSKLTAINDASKLRVVIYRDRCVRALSTEVTSPAVVTTARWSKFTARTRLT